MASLRLTICVPKHEQLPELESELVLPVKDKPYRKHGVRYAHNVSSDRFF
jgi:hypothetical protein